MGYRKCCVTNCKSTIETHSVYRIPKDKELRSLWMSYLVPQNSSLLMLREDQISNKTVCQLHFERRMFDPQGVKIKNAYPSLFSEKEISHGVQLVTDCNLKEEHNYCKKAHDDEDMHPMSSVPSFIQRPGEMVEHLYDTADQSSCLKSQESCISTPKNFPSTSLPVTSDILLMDSRSNVPNLVQDTTSVQKQKDFPSTSLPVTSDILPMDSRTNVPNLIQDTTSVQKQKVLSLKRKIGAKSRKLATKIIEIAKNSVGDNSALRTEQAQNLFSSELMSEVHKLNNQTKTLIMMQLKSVRSNKVTRRYTLQEKILCLTIWKISRKSYKLLKHMFSLPSERTLARLSEKIIFETGLNENILAVIKEKSKKWSTQKRLCSIVFDEVSINTQLTFNEEKDIIYGFCDIAGDRKMRYCDHALVIMIRGVCSSWRQPLAYYFCEGTIAAVELKNILKEVVAKVSASGLLPLALICDQGSTFRTAIQQLRLETIQQRTIDNISDDGTINISGHDVSVIYDPPHLIKGIRNNFLTKNMIFDKKIAKWNDILTIYDIDNTLGHTRAMPKLTRQHVDKDCMRKMRVSVATQTLSARVAAMLRYTDAVVKHKDGGSLSPTMATTADVVEFFDQLFDSVNGRPGDVAKGKLRTAVKLDSRHVSFWQNAKKKISEIKFIDKNGHNAYVPSIRGWITTLESFIRITKLLFSKYGVTFFYPRLLNQDPLENFFGRLRANNYRNVIPDTNAFIYTFKSLVLSNILSPISKFANCEEDEGDQLVTIELLFQNLKEVNEGNKENICPNVPSTSGSCQTNDLPPVISEKVKVHCSAYVAGYLIKKINNAMNCFRCKNTLITKEISSIHKYIMYREYKTLKNCNLAYPAEKFLLLYRKCAEIIHNYLNNYCILKNVGFTLKKIFENQCDVEWMGCSNPDHKDKLKQLFFKMIIKVQVHNWVKIINKILRGAIEAKYVNKMEAPQMKALLKFQKNKRKSKIKA